MERLLSSKIPFFLHFDINKTVIISDPVANIAQDDMLNSLLSECVWGDITTINKENFDEKACALSDWKLRSPIPSQTPPAPDLSLTGNDDLITCTFGEFLENYTQAPRADRKKLKTSFTKSGNVGEGCHPYLQVLKQAMTVPDDVDVSIADTDDVSPFLSEVLKSKQYHILPSFVHLISKLDEMNVDFTLVFRTFGIDIPRVAEEFNLICEGKHPFFKCCRKMDGSNGGIDRRLYLPDYSGKLHRTSTESSGSGVLLAHVSPEKIVRIAAGAPEISKVLTDWSKTARSVAVQDDFTFWHSNGESDESGKLLLVQRPNHPSTVQQHIELFFDDNIERDRAHIVDVRYGDDSFEAVPFTESEGVFLRRVEPYLAITDVEYFVKEVAAAVERQFEWIDRRKNV